MKTIILALLLTISGWAAQGARITIIESQSFLAGHVMDEHWRNMLQPLGHTVTIAQQAALDNLAALTNADLLIVSSGVIALTSARIATLQQFVQSGRPLYLQSEYQATYTTNQAFAVLVGTLGGHFQWGQPYTGDLAPVRVLGSMATTPVAAPAISTFWYSVDGNGDCSVTPFLEAQGGHHGFLFTPPNRAYGAIATTADQDWILGNASPALMRNIIAHLFNPGLNTQAGVQVALGRDTTLCAGATLRLQIQLPAGTTCQWQNGSTGPTQLVQQSGVYWVRVTAGTCSATDSIRVTFQVPPRRFLGPDTSFCPGQRLTLRSAYTGASYRWQNGATTSSLTVQQPGTYWLRVTSAQGCEATDTVRVTAAALPFIDLGADTALCAGETLRLGSPPTPSVRYVWSDGLTTSVRTVSAPGTYWLRATSTAGCTRTDTLNVRPGTCFSLLLPNVFTPDHDGLNDIFTPIECAGITRMTTTIYNRWGRQIFRTDQRLIEWDGQGAAAGPYYWQLDYTRSTGATGSCKGWVELVR